MAERPTSWGVETDLGNCFEGFVLVGLRFLGLDNDADGVSDVRMALVPDGPVAADGAADVVPL